MIDTKIDDKYLPKISEDVYADNNKDGNQKLTNNCYWCYDIKNLTTCRYCNRNFCRFCVKSKIIDHEETFVCLICECYESSKVMSNGISCTNDRELIDMLHRYESLCNKSKLIKNITKLYDDIDSIEVKHFSEILTTIHSNIIAMLKDFEILKKIMKEAIIDDNMEVSKLMLLPLLKVTMKHHLFNRLTISNQYLAKNVAFHDFVFSREDESPLPVVKDEKIITSTLRIVDDETIKDDLHGNSQAINNSKVVNVDALKRLNNPGLEANQSNFFLNKPHDIKDSDWSSLQSSFISFNAKETSPKRIKLELDEPYKQHLSSDLSTITKDLSRFEQVSSFRQNPHLVAPADICTEKSFVIKSTHSEDDDLVIAPPVQKHWSWERDSFKLVIPPSYRITLNDSLSDDIQAKFRLKSSLKKKSPGNKIVASTDKTAEEEPRKRGRPRKYFSNFKMGDDFTKNFDVG